MDKVYIFIHIPKTAGTTLRYHFQKHLIDQSEFIHFANKGNKIAKDRGLLPYEQRSIAERNEAKVILGHNVDINTKNLISEKETVELVIFRNPKEWIISRYNQYANSKLLNSHPYLCYEEWLKIEKIQSQFDWFLINYCKLKQIPSDETLKYNLLINQLSLISHVCFVDNLDNYMQDIFIDLKIPKQLKRENVTGENRKQNLFAENKLNLAHLNQQSNKENNLFLKIKNKFDLFF